MPEAGGWGQRIVRQQASLGMTQKESARRLGVDQGTLARWERGEREPWGKLLDLVKRFLKDTDAPSTEAPRAG